MDFSFLQDMLWTIVQGVLTIALPIVVYAFLDWMAAKIKKARLSLSEDQNYLVDRVVEVAVRAIEQAKANGLVEDGEQALAAAVDVAQKELDRMGVRIDVDMLVDRVEAGYHTWVVSRSD